MKFTSALLALAASCLVTASPVPDSTNTTEVDITPRQAPPPVTTANLRNCNADWQKTRVMQILKDVQLLGNAAANGVGNDYYKAWFGSGTAGGVSDSSIQKRFQKFGNWISAPPKDVFFNCDVTNSGCSRRTIVAYTTRYGSEIVLCSPWWRAPVPYLSALSPPSINRPTASLDNYVTPGSQLLHELTHAWFGTDDQKLQNGQSAYSHKNTLQLAREDQGKARQNADNYAFYALASYLTSVRRTHFSTDPNNLIQGGDEF